MMVRSKREGKSKGMVPLSGLPYALIINKEDQLISDGIIIHNTGAFTPNDFSELVNDETGELFETFLHCSCPQSL